MRGLSARLAPRLGPALFRVLARSWRVRRVDEPDLGGASAPPVFALWHENIPAGAALHTRRGYTVMISSHHDGEMITRIVESLGYRTARGSSTRGGARAMREMLRLSQDSGPLVLTPDGPRGPAHEPAPGIFYLAGVTGRPLVAVGFAAARAWRANSWDRMVIAKPFSRVAVVYAPSMSVPREVLRDERLLEEARVTLLDRFADAHARAEAELAR